MKRMTLINLEVVFVFIKACNYLAICYLGSNVFLIYFRYVVWLGYMVLISEKGELIEKNGAPKIDTFSGKR